MSTKSVEKAIVAAVKAGGQVSYVDGVVDSVSPYRVLCTGETEAVEVDPLVQRPAVGRRVAVFAVGAHRFSIPFPEA